MNTTRKTKTKAKNTAATIPMVRIGLILVRASYAGSQGGGQVNNVC